MGEALIPVIAGSARSADVIGYNCVLTTGDNGIVTTYPSVFEQSEIALDMSKTYLVMVMLCTTTFDPSSTVIKSGINTPVVYTLVNGTFSPKIVVSGTSYTSASVIPSIDTTTGVLSFPSTKVSNGSWFCAVSELT